MLILLKKRGNDDETVAADASPSQAISHSIIHQYLFPKEDMRLQVACIQLLCALFYFNNANAQAMPDYQCRVERIDTASTEPSSSRKYQEEEHVGKQFTVERRTGLMAGVLKNSYATKPIVIDHGSTENSFKVISTMRRDEGAGLGSNIYALTINEFEQSPKKSFIFLRNDFVYFGYCEHF